MGKKRASFRGVVMPKEFDSVTALMQSLRRDFSGMVEAAHPVLREVGEEIKAHAQAKIGLLNPGWESLAPATQAERERLGYAPNEPLLRDGTLRDAITYDVDYDHVLIGVKSEQVTAATGKSVDIGDVAVWQEHGTETIPPRPFLAPALHENAEHVGNLIAEHLVASIRRKVG